LIKDSNPANSILLAGMGNQATEPATAERISLVDDPEIMV